MALNAKKPNAETMGTEQQDADEPAFDLDSADPRNIVICCDGTGNVGGAVTPTNVWRIRQAIAQTKMEGEPEQLLIYQDGVGTSPFQPLEILGKAISYGITANLEELYGRLVHLYQPGDRIFLFGFSRGAFTARLFANLLYRCGLASRVSPDGQPYQPHEIRNLAGRAVNAYKMRLVKDSDAVTFDEKFRLQYGMDLDGSLDNQGRVPIEFMGMWDTVAAVGFPFEGFNQVLLNGWSRVMSIPAFRWAKFAQLNFHRTGHWSQWRDDDLHPKIRRAYHALAIDDERQAFRPVLWNEFKVDQGQASDSAPSGKRKEETHVEQVWFSGMHANVGGGYPKDGLAYVSLNWMMEKAHEAGLRFEFPTWQRYLHEIDALGQIADSRSGLATYYRYKPRQISKLADEVGITGKGEVVRLPAIHDSVFHRIDKSTDSYAPIALPAPGAYREIKSLPSDKHPTSVARIAPDGGDDLGQVVSIADAEISTSGETTEQQWRWRMTQPSQQEFAAQNKHAAGTDSESQERTPPRDGALLDRVRLDALKIADQYIGLRRCLFYLFFSLTVVFVLVGLFGTQPGKLARIENAIYGSLGYLVNLIPIHRLIVIVATPPLIAVLVLSYRSWARAKADTPPALSDPTPIGSIIWRAIAFMVLAMILRPLVHMIVTSMLPVAGEKLVGVLGSPGWFALFAFAFYLTIKLNAYCAYRMHEWSRHAWRVALGKEDQSMQRNKTDEFASRFSDPLPDEGLVDRWVVPFVAFAILGAALAYPIWITVHDVVVRMRLSTPPKTEAISKERIRNKLNELIDQINSSTGEKWTLTSPDGEGNDEADPKP